MRLRLKASKIEISPEVKKYVQEKMDMLDKYLGEVKVQNCDVELEKIAGEQKHGAVYRAEANLSLPGDLLRVKKTTKDLNKAIDKVKDHLAEMIKKYKSRKQDQKKGK